MKYVFCLILALSLVGCTGSSSGSTKSPGLPPINIAHDNVIVKSRAVFTISAGTPTVAARVFNFLVPTAYASSGSQFVSVVNSPSSTLTLDATNFSPPAISNAVLDFGNIQVSDLLDNNLNLCGVGGDEQCGTALLRIYTTGTAGAGLYNAVDDFGAPILAGPNGGALATVGLDPANSIIVDAISIPASKHVVRLSDFTNQDFQFQIDFTDAGAGAYETTLVIEYALAP